jgi:hypothetical protein
MFLGRADNNTAICEPIVWTILNISQPYSPARPVTGIALLSRQCRILNISQPYRPPVPVTGIPLPYGDGVRFL